ncbi:armadillo-type protein [Phakopsora pachyrhizi]|uniref:Armadillo-type protein n=1 Tax=Phakopsora pachyrhizi TaxID=170000 RepID=A0AAV0AU91_PHAPC|nr:armadillo-type protein [Phakopsora pachyrhizi]
MSSSRPQPQSLSQPINRLSKLRFRKSLTKDSKLTATELIKRLSSLLDELMSLDQDLVDTESLSTVRDELIRPPLLVHKDKTVKALVACCLADLLRLYAPDAPYTLSELKDIFQFFFRQIRNMSGSPSQCPNLPHYTRLVDCLSTVRSIVLACDVPQSDELINEIFQVLFTVVSTELSQNVLLSFADILTQTLTADSSVVPPSVIKTLLDQFRSKNLKANPAAYRLAVDVCNACEDRLKQDVCRYFNDLLAAGFRHFTDQLDSEGSDNDSSVAEEGSPRAIQELEETHSLIKNVYRSCPGLLQSVIPQLEVGLQNSEVKLRSLAVQTLGELFAEQPIGSSTTTLGSTSIMPKGSVTSAHWSSHFYAGNDLARRYPSTWVVWLRKANDVSPQIRVDLVRCCGKILSKHPHLYSDINRVLLARLLDLDEKVRMECCKLFGELDFELALQHINVKVLKALASRIEDRKVFVQQEALKSLGRFYSLAFTTIEADSSEAISQFSWIPEAFLSSMFAGDTRLCFAAEKMFLKFIAPVPANHQQEEGWVDRLITISKYLDDIGLKKLKAFARIGIKRPNGFDKFLEACNAYNGGVIDQQEKEATARLAQVIRQISSYFPDSVKAMDDLRKFAKLNDKQVCKLLKTLSSDQNDFKTFTRAYEEFFRRIKSYPNSIAETVEVFLHKSSFLILNSSSIPTLLRKVQSEGAEESLQDGTEVELKPRPSTSSRAKYLLDMISAGCPTMLKRNTADLIATFSRTCLSESDQPTVEACLFALSQVVKTDSDAVPDDEFVILILKFQSFSSILAVKPSFSAHCTKISEKLADSLPQALPSQMVGYLGGLSRIAKHSTKVFEMHGAAVTSFIVKNLLVQSSEGDQETKSDWVTDEELCDLSRARVVGLKVLTNRCIIYSSTPEAMNFSTPIFKLFWQLLENDGSIGVTRHSPPVASRLRLQAAQSILKLATYTVFTREVDSHFETLAGISQDPLYQVREKFITKLVKYLQQRRLRNIRFNVILFLVAHDPEPDIIRLARISIQSRLKAMTEGSPVVMFETTIVQLLHLLTHHPDFQTSASELHTFSKYIDFFIECVANRENISLLYHLAGQLKTVRDAESQTHTEYIHTLSELAQLLIKCKAKEHHWPLPTYPGKVKLPMDIFRPLPTPAIAHEISKKTYLDEDTMETLMQLRGQSSKKDKHENVAIVKTDHLLPKRSSKKAALKSSAARKKKLKIGNEEEGSLIEKIKKKKK